MALSSIAVTTKSHIARLMATAALKFGIATHCWYVATIWVKQKLLHIIMRMGNCASQVWIIDPIILALLLDVIDKGNIPLKHVTGFYLSSGRWYIRIKDIGWLRTSDLLQMAIEINPPQEEVK